MLKNLGGHPLGIRRPSFGKIRVLAKSRNRCKFIQVLLQCIGFYIFTLFQASYVDCHWSERFYKLYTPVVIKAFSLFSIVYQRPLVMGHELNILSLHCHAMKNKNANHSVQKV